MVVQAAHYVREQDPLNATRLETRDRTICRAVFLIDAVLLTLY